ncbi:hypothetical protein N7G274_010533 [Stereocaulon virgatum]|uniref:L-tryptophan decarboxylase PsiD-like domain-containing protein n=1 Tax=Stereocaulon virgatum TaxID=373712 RepID=A0ABR3ZVH5_9LECA
MGGRSTTLQEELQSLIDDPYKKPRTLANSNAPLLPVIREFKDLIEGDAEVYMLFHCMFDQIPNSPTYRNDPSGKPQVRDYKTMLSALNLVIRYAPIFLNVPGRTTEYASDMLEWPMATPAGSTAFLNAKVNAQLKKILNDWATYLRSPESRSSLTNDQNGWFGEPAMKSMPNFDEEFICDPNAPFHGFSSWDDFFTRQYRPGIRPVEFPDNDSIIANACEAGPFRVAYDVKANDKFWIKDEPYSLNHMLANDDYAPRFNGGTVYQALLHSKAYHRWHSPVSGVIRKAYIVPGAYFAANSIQGFDALGPHRSLAYITQVNTRAVIFIEADDPSIGLMCFLAVGMCEFSSCECTVVDGQRVIKGEQLGIFHYGGSTYCLIFRPETKITFHLQDVTPGLGARDWPVRSALASVGGGRKDPWVLVDGCESIRVTAL